MGVRWSHPAKVEEINSWYLPDYLVATSIQPEFKRMPSSFGGQREPTWVFKFPNRKADFQVIRICSSQYL